MYKVHTVEVVPSLRKLSSDERNNESKREGNQVRERKSFSQILDTESEKLQAENISITTSGYTKSAKPFRTVILMRDYTYPADDPLRTR